MNEKIKVAFIGAGLMAEEHIKAFSDINDVELHGIYSRTNLRATALALKYGICNNYESIHEMFHGTHADLVVVAVSELSVNMVCREVFKYPWISLIEKPVGYNLNDAETILEAAKESGCHAFVGLNRRHFSSTRAVSREIEDVDGQRIVQIFDQENPIVALESGRPSLVVENWMYANSIHIIDYFCLFCRGEILDIEHVNKWTPENPYFVLAKISYSSGDIGLYQAIWNGPGPWAVTVTTPMKRWELRPLEQATSQLYKSREIKQIATHGWDTAFKAGLRLQAEEAIHAVRGEAHALPSLADAVATMKIVSKIYEP